MAGPESIAKESLFERFRKLRDEIADILKENHELAKSIRDDLIGPDQPVESATYEKEPQIDRGYIGEGITHTEAAMKIAIRTQENLRAIRQEIPNRKAG